MGISREHLPKIFERFYRVDNRDNREIGGTGIGLALVKALVEEGHHGKVTVESELGKGTTFTVILPVRRQAGLGELGNASSRSSVTPMRWICRCRAMRRRARPGWTSTPPYGRPASGAGRARACLRPASVSPSRKAMRRRCARAAAWRCGRAWPWSTRRGPLTRTTGVRST